MSRALSSPATSGGVLEECQSSPGLLLALLGQVAMRRLREALTAHDLKPRQFQLLGLLHERRAAMGQRELAESMGIDPSILVTLLNPLEAAGFLSRERDPADRRRHLVRLTGAGRGHLESAMRAQREAEDGLFGGLEEDQRRQLSAVLVALRESLLASGVQDACPPSETTEEC